MCDELETALEAQETLGADTTKGASLLFKAALKSMRKQGAEMKQIAEDFKHHVEESDKKLAALSNDFSSMKDMMEGIKEDVKKFQLDATKWQLVVQLLNALFGTVKRFICTMIVFVLITGLAHFQDLIDLLKALI